MGFSMRPILLSYNPLSAFIILCCAALAVAADDSENTKASSSSKHFAAEEDYSLGPPLKNGRYCTFSFDRFHCVANPLEVRDETFVHGSLEYGEREMSTGVPQRIAGSEKEREAIRELLLMQDDYFFREVFSMPEYASVRTKCRNRSELCTYWAAIGECETNRIFMIPNCAPACRLCLLRDTNIG